MANYAGVGAGPAKPTTTTSSRPLSLSPLVSRYDFSYYGWDEEEEEKRRRRQELLEGKLKRIEEIEPISMRPRQYFEQAAAAARAKASTLDQGITSPLQEYMQLARLHGGEKKFQERIATINSLWKTYMGSYSGSAAVWDLAKSPYSIEQIESMLAIGHLPMFSGGSVPAAKVRELGLDPRNETHAKAADIYYSVAGPGHAAIVAPGVLWLDNIWNGLKRVAEIWQASGVRPDPGSVAAAMLKEVGQKVAGAAKQTYEALAPKKVPISELHIEDMTDEELRALALRVNGGIQAIREAQRTNGTVEVVSETSQALSEMALWALATYGLGALGAAAGTAGELIGVGGTALRATSTLRAAATAAPRAAQTVTALGAISAGTRAGYEAFEQDRLDTVNKRFEEARAALAELEKTPLDKLRSYNWQTKQDEDGNEIPVLASAAERINAGLDYVEWLNQQVAVKLKDGTTLDPKAEIKAIQEALQQDVYDDEGNVVIFGKGKNLEANGILTDEWRYAIREALEDAERSKLENARWLMENGYVPSWAPFDNLEHEVWERGRKKAEEDYQYWQRAYRDNPILAKLRELSGLPFWGPAGLEKFFNRLFANGVAQGIYKLPLEIAIKAGETADAAMAAFGVYARLHNDEEYQRWKTQLALKAAKQMGLPEFMPPTMEQIEEAVQNGTIDDDGLLEKIRQREAQVVEQRFSPAILLDIQHLFGARSAQAIEEWGRNNPDVIHASQFLFDVGFGLIAPIKMRGKPLPRTYAAFVNDYRATSRVLRAAQDIKKGNLSDIRWAGTDAYPLIREFDATWRGAANSLKLRSVAQNLIRDSERGWLYAIEKHTALRGEAARTFAAEMIRAEREAEKLYPVEGYAEPAKLPSTEIHSPTVVAARVAAEATEPRMFQVLAGVHRGEIGSLVMETPKMYTLDTGQKIIRVAKTSVEPFFKRYIYEYEVTSGKYAGLTGHIASETDKTFVLDTNIGSIRVLKDKVKRLESPAITPIPRPLPQTGVSWAEPPMPSVYPLREAAVRRALVENVYKWQRTQHNIVDLEDYMLDMTARAWSAENGHPADIFPDLQYPELKTPSETARFISIKLRNIRNDDARKLLTHVFSKFQRTTLDSIDFDVSGSADVIMQAARVASDDELWAAQMANRWIRAGSARAKKAIAKEIVAMAEKRFDLGATFARRRRKPEEGVFEEIMPNPETGEPVGWRATGKPAMTPDTSYQAYKALFGRVSKAVRAPYKLNPEDMSWFERASHRWIDNPYRTFLRAVTPVSRTMRQIAVALGPQLFVKHGVTDTARTIIENGPGAVAFARRTNKLFDEIVGKQLDADTFAHVMRHHVKAELSEQHYNVGRGNLAYRYTAGRIYDENLRPTGMKAGVAALRRITQGKYFATYVKQGEAGLREALKTKEGIRWMYENNVVKAYKDAAGPDAPKGRALIDAAAEHYIQTWVKGYWEPLEMNAPGIYKGIADIVISGRNPTAKEIEAIVKRVNKDIVRENPFLSMEVGEALTLANAPGRLTGLWMTTNKWNRRLLFRDTFVKVYKDLTKQGADPNSAARVAATIADLNTSRVHFDLSHAMLLEQQNRWFAWFATKHRLYHTYLMKMALQRPTIAAAAVEVARWLEEANEDLGEDSYDKYTIRFFVGDIGLRIPIAPIFWLSDYPLESNIGRGLFALGAVPVNLVTGRELHAGPGIFDWQISPVDGLIGTIALYVPLWKSMRSGSELTEEEISDWLENHVKGSVWGGQEAYEQMCRNITLQRAIAKSNGEGEIDVVEATKRAMLANYIYQVQQTIRLPVKVDPAGGPKKELEKLFDEYIKHPPDEREEFIRKHPEVGIMIGMSHIDPVAKMEIERGWDDLNRLQARRAIELTNAFRINPDADLSPILRKYRREISKIFDPNILDENGEHYPLYNPVFTEYFNKYGGDLTGMIDDLIVIRPVTEQQVLKSAVAQTRVPTTEEIEQKRDELQRTFTTAMQQWGITTSNPLYSYYHDIMVEEPLAAFRKDDPTKWATEYENTVARYLAQGPEGEKAAAAYLLEVENRHKLAIIKKGTNGLSKDGVEYPIFMCMSKSERQKTGWIGTPKSNHLWALYRSMWASTKVYMERNGIKSTSKLGKQMLQRLQDLGEMFSTLDETFAKEWRFANMPLHERLRELGVGRGDSERDRGWAEMLDIVEDYHRDLKALNNGKGLSPSASGARETALFYLRKIVRLAKKNKAFRRSFVQNFTLSNFGFYFKMPDGSDAGLWTVEEEEI